MADWLVIPDNTVLQKGISTGALLGVTLLANTILRRIIIRNVSQKDLRLRWVVTVRNVLLLGFILGVVFIWAAALRTFAVSVAAIAVALVLATKELILCVSGYVLRTTGDSFAIGDRIEIGSFRGDVIDQNVFTTTLLEVGPGHAFHLHTGRTVVFPNSMMLTTPIVNESALQKYVMHSLNVPLRAGEDWRKAEQALLAAAEREIRPYLEDARRHMQEVEATHGFSSPSVEPRVSLQILTPGTVNLLLRVPCPVGRQGRVEQAILRDFLQTQSAGPEATQETGQSG